MYSPSMTCEFVARIPGATRNPVPLPPLPSISATDGSYQATISAVESGAPDGGSVRESVVLPGFDSEAGAGGDDANACRAFLANSGSSDPGSEATPVSSLGLLVGRPGEFGSEVASGLEVSVGSGSDNGCGGAP
ncbi:hypothetical protein SAMN05444166_1939 [Singulisphaera sp. GP187]|nr:hypothetical protein SAMN05444166_1939 [Singulisphaera sp. GP187]